MGTSTLSTRILQPIRIKVLLRTNRWTMKCCLQCQELLNNLQNEVADTVKELTKSKKKYFETEQMATLARDKYHEVNERFVFTFVLLLPI